MRRAAGGSRGRGGACIAGKEDGGARSKVGLPRRGRGEDAWNRVGGGRTWGGERRTALLSLDKFSVLYFISQIILGCVKLFL